MTDDERAKWEAQVADIAARRANRYVMLEREIESLRRLAWDSAAIAQREYETLVLDYAILADDLREQITECERLRLTLGDFFRARDEQVAALEQERDALRLSLAMMRHEVNDD